MNDYVAKPVDWDQLRQVLERNLPKSAHRTGGPAALATSDANQAGDGAVLDVHAVMQLQQLGEAHATGAHSLRDMASEFVRNTDTNMERGTQALRSSDWDELARTAHLLRGSLGAYGAMAGASVCHELEQAARSHNPSAAQAAMKDLAVQWPVIRQAVLATFFSNRS